MSTVEVIRFSPLPFEAPAVGCILYLATSRLLSVGVFLSILHSCFQQVRSLWTIGCWKVYGQTWMMDQMMNISMLQVGCSPSKYHLGIRRSIYIPLTNVKTIIVICLFSIVRVVVLGLHGWDGDETAHKSAVIVYLMWMICVSVRSSQRFSQLQELANIDRLKHDWNLGKSGCPFRLLTVFFVRLSFLGGLCVFLPHNTYFLGECHQSYDIVHWSGRPFEWVQWSGLFGVSNIPVK